MKFKICVGRREYHTVEMEVEAESQEDAEEQAYINADEQDLEWLHVDDEQFIVECEEVVTA